MDWVPVRGRVQYNRCEKTRKTPREQLLPSSNFTGFVAAYGLRKNSILWVQERGYATKVDLDAHLGLKHGQVCAGRGFSLDPNFESSELRTVNGYCRLYVNSTSWIDLDHFIGYTAYDLRVSDLSNISDETSASICSYRAPGWFSGFFGG